MRRIVTGLLVLITISACSRSTPATREPTPVSLPALAPTLEPTEFLPTLPPRVELTASATRPATTAVREVVATPSPTVSLNPAAWQSWPVIPVVSPRMKEVYQKGIALGNNPRTFSKVGDCQNISSYFLSVFDTPGEYRLGEYANLQSTIDYFNGSFARDSLAVRGGFNVASVLSPFWSDPAQCNKGENPLACEFRYQRPSIAIVSMETWWSGKPASEYEDYLRQIVEFALNQGVVPILATKADNWEGDHSLNAAVARVASDYEVPVWNYWLAVQPLPGHGLTTDGFHLTYARNFFDDPVRMQSAWPIRNLTALQVIDAVWRAVQ